MAGNGQPGRSSDTARESLNLFRSGKTIAEIASLRTPAPTTIEGHLSLYVQKGEVDIRAFVSPEKQTVIQEAVNSYGAERLAPLKEVLGDTYSYGEIRATVAWMRKMEMI